MNAKLCRESLLLSFYFVSLNVKKLKDIIFCYPKNINTFFSLNFIVFYFHNVAFHNA